MYAQLSIHRPKPGNEKEVIDSMHRFQKAISGYPGLVSVGTFRDRKSSRIVGVALWDSWDSMVAARSAMAEATKLDRFDEWEEVEMDTLHADEI